MVIKLANARKYYLHKITKEITDASFGEIIRQLSHKTRFKGKHFYQ